MNLSTKRIVFIGLASLVLAPIAAAQLPGNTGNTGNTGPNNIGGVYIDPQGMVRYRQVDDKLATVRVTRDEKLCYVSLPRAFAEAKSLMAAGKPLPDRLRYLGGLTQLRYILVYPEQKDLVIAGPAETWQQGDALQPRGQVTGRPVLHLDDLVVAMRVVAQHGRAGAIGCTLDPRPDAMQRAQEVLGKFGGRANAQLTTAVSEAMGPLNVGVFGAARTRDSRWPVSLPTTSSSA